MNDHTGDLTPATVSETLLTLSFALKHKGKRAFRNGDTLMAEITAAHLLEHLEASGFVLMKKPPGRPHSTGGNGRSST